MLRPQTLPKSAFRISLQFSAGLCSDRTGFWNAVAGQKYAFTARNEVRQVGTQLAVSLSQKMSTVSGQNVSKCVRKCV